MIYGYIRVSSDKQTVENQRFEINKFWEREKMNIDGWIEKKSAVQSRTTSASWANCWTKRRRTTLSSAQSCRA
jgi:hypothetical protein